MRKNQYELEIELKPSESNLFSNAFIKEFFKWLLKEAYVIDTTIYNDHGLSHFFKSAVNAFAEYYKGDLYKTKNPKFTFQSQWIPGQGTESIYERIDVTHKGTADDPIPYDGNMELFSGKYYTQDGVLYLCTRDTGAAVYHPLSALVGLYVEVVNDG
jgi:hypothetical protein